MRVFVVLASLAVLASADVKHLFDSGSGFGHGHGHSTHTVTHTSGGSRPVVNFVPGTTTVQHNYIKPHVITTPVATSHHFVQQNPVSTSTHYSGSGFGYGSGSSSNYGLQNAGYGSSSGYGGSSSHGGVYGSGYTGGYGGAYRDSASYGGVRTTFIKQTAPIVSKSTYVYSAPEDHEELRDETLVLPRPKEHYKVVFIKAPATTIVNTPSAALGAQNKEKTLIYVLSDKKRIENHVDLPAVDQVKPQKPEVFFVKHNLPTEVRKSQVRYETVGAIAGAENGAVNGVANKVSHSAAGAFQDEASNGQQNAIAQTIFQSVKQGGLESGVQTVNQLIAGGHSVSTGYEGANYNNGGAAYTTGSGSAYNGGAYNNGFGTSYDTISTVSKPAYTVQKTTYTTGVVQPAYTTSYVQQPASVTYGSDAGTVTSTGGSGFRFGSSGSTGSSGSYSESTSDCVSC